MSEFNLLHCRAEGRKEMLKTGVVHFHFSSCPNGFLIESFVLRVGQQGLTNFFSPAGPGQPHSSWTNPSQQQSSAPSTEVSHQMWGSGGPGCPTARRSLHFTTRVLGITFPATQINLSSFPTGLLLVQYLPHPKQS